MIRVPTHAFTGVPANPSNEWRQELLEWAAKEAIKRKRLLAIRMIQRLGRNIIAPVMAQRLKDKAAHKIAKARRRWLKVLRSVGLDKRLVGQKLMKMGVMNPVVRCVTRKAFHGVLGACEGVSDLCVCMCGCCCSLSPSLSTASTFHPSSRTSPCLQACGAGRWVAIEWLCVDRTYSLSLTVAVSGSSDSCGSNGAR